MIGFKPCNMCGSKDVVLVCVYNRPAGVWKWSSNSYYCECMFCNFKGRIKKSSKKAIRDWNRKGIHFGWVCKGSK